MFKINSKGQATTEILIILVFVIIFLSIFNNLVYDTARLIKINKITEQQNEITDSVYSFLKFQEGFIREDVETTQLYFLDFNLSYNIPNIYVPLESPKCKLIITPKHITLETQLSNEDVLIPIRTTKEINLDMTKLHLIEPIEVNCGDKIDCKYEILTNKIECN